MEKIIHVQAPLYVKEMIDLRVKTGEIYNKDILAEAVDHILACECVIVKQEINDRLAKYKGGEIKHFQAILFEERMKELRAKTGKNNQHALAEAAHHFLVCNCIEDTDTARQAAKFEKVLQRRQK